jgi:hypothetical protein
VVARDHHREERCPARLAGLDVRDVGALSEVDGLFEPPRPPGGFAQVLEVLGAEQPVGVGLVQ